jgi:SAM-dependent methyltransferase
VEGIETLRHGNTSARELKALRQRADDVLARINAVDHEMWDRVREEIRSGRLRGEALAQRMALYAGQGPMRPWRQDPVGYDALDDFLSGLFRVDMVPRETLTRDDEMVFYQPTPSRVVLRLVERAPMTAEDRFFDLGSGLGQVCIIVALLTGARVTGVEYEPAFCEYARQSAEGLSVGNVDFVNADAREADLEDGTFFFMYTPFWGGILRQVLDRLMRISRDHPIRIGTYGPCTDIVASEKWLRPMRWRGRDLGMDGADGPAIWESVVW